MTVKGSARPLTLYTLDIAEDEDNQLVAAELDPTVLPSDEEAAEREDELQRQISTLHEIEDESELVAQDQLEAEKDALQELDQETQMFRRTTAIYEMRRTTTADFMDAWDAALRLYLAGQWGDAMPLFRRCSRMLPTDGPTQTLIGYLERRNCQAPAGWTGARRAAPRPACRGARAASSAHRCSARRAPRGAQACASSPQSERRSRASRPLHGVVGRPDFGPSPRTPSPLARKRCSCCGTGRTQSSCHSQLSCTPGDCQVVPKFSFSIFLITWPGAAMMAVVLLVASRAARSSGLGAPRRGFHASRVTMKLRTGIVGMPNVGKSTLFNALTETQGAEAANYPFCTIEPNTGVVEVPDPRLKVLAEINKSVKVVPASLEFVDIAGLVKGASTGEGLGNQFLANIRECDAITHVVRCFDDPNVIHVVRRASCAARAAARPGRMRPRASRAQPPTASPPRRGRARARPQDGSVDPVRDADVINLELVLADLAQVEKRLERCAKDKKTDPTEKAALAKVKEVLNLGKPARSLLPDLSVEERVWLDRLQLLTAKKMIYAANVPDSDMANGNELVRKLDVLAKKEGASVVVVSAQVEAELIDLSPEERAEFLESLGVSLDDCGLRRLVRAAYDLLGLRTYFTSGPTETRAWTIQQGWTAPQAAGVIHGDFERGFIRAETIGYDDLVKAGSEKGARDAGVLRSEGKEYVVNEGDVMLFRFNV